MRRCPAPGCGVEVVRRSSRGRWPKWCPAHKGHTKSPDSKTAVCAEPDCERKVRAQSLCSMHLKRLGRQEGFVHDEPWDDRRRRNFDLRRKRMNGARNGDKAILSELLTRGSTCAGCAAPIDLELRSPHPMSRTIDHIVPVARGGEHVIDNCQLMHLRCNASKGVNLLSRP